jgi:hypothetical protein
MIFTDTIEFEWLEELAKPFGLTSRRSEDIGEKPSGVIFDPANEAPRVN